MNIILFGSTSDSVIVAETIHAKFPLAAVVTQPEKPTGRKQIITKTPLEIWASEQKIPCMTFLQNDEQGWKFNNDAEVTNSLSSFKPDLFVTACYGQKLPTSTLALPTKGSLNIHPSLLPRWRGADPVPWTIIAGDAQTGVTISLVTDTFDSGDIIAQKKVPVHETDTVDAIRTTLFTLGAQLLVETLPEYVKGNCDPIPQKDTDVVVARKLKREDGFIPFSIIMDAVNGKDTAREQRQQTLLQEMTGTSAHAVIQLIRALSPWPGVWTTISIQGTEKRLKILDAIIRNEQLTIGHVQLEGKTPVDWEMFTAAYNVR